MKELEAASLFKMLHRKKKLFEHLFHWLFLLKFNATCSVLVKSVEMMHFNLTVLFTMKIYQGETKALSIKLIVFKWRKYVCTTVFSSVLTGTEFLLAAEMQHLVARALSSAMLADVRWHGLVFAIVTSSPNKNSNCQWLQSYFIRQTEVAIPCRKIKLTI